MKDIKIALFDIDKTLIKGDSMFKLLKYTLKKYPKSSLKLPTLFFVLILYKLGFIDTKKAKENMFYTLNYLDNEDIKKFFYEVIKGITYNDAIGEIKRLKSKGYYILLVSASPECYLKFFELEEYIDGVIGTKLHFKNNKYVNKIDGYNCKGEEKVKRINEYLKERNLSIDKESSLAYSDSLSDLPMFNLVGKAYLINYNKKNLDYEILRWK
ncbi:HAD family hydrolase [Clostridium perfringens]|uniref:HAD family hydrolase n=1 Tax=Clostridium perfringens TaxID=1502 RepID=A0A2X3C2H7_CLOPF|nr:HAD family hydrolase [Clostridium perfringens]SQC08317.1 HAD family hydrolase [Clostridium perfringens]